jgi:hypothetical protein
VPIFAEWLAFVRVMLATASTRRSHNALFQLDEITSFTDCARLGSVKLRIHTQQNDTPEERPESEISYRPHPLCPLLTPYLGLGTARVLPVLHIFCRMARAFLLLIFVQEIYSCGATNWEGSFPSGQLAEN